MKMKTHDITGHKAGQTWRSALQGIAICSAVLCLMAACSREEALSDPATVGMYDGSLTIRANIEGLLETRATHEEGLLENDDETWVLSTKWGDLDYTEYFEADFSKGYGEFKDRDDSIVEIKWSNLKADVYGIYTIGLDNGPTGWVKGGGYPVNDCWVSEKQRHYVNFANFGAESARLLARYKAQVEPEGNRMAPNDLVAGAYQEARNTAMNKRWINITLRHLMSRVHVEITAPIIDELETQNVRVWLFPLAEKCYGMERQFVNGENHSGVLIDSIMLSSSNWVLVPEKSGDKVFTSKLYLLGSAEESEHLLPVQDKEGTYRTHYLIMPPQTTHLSEEGKQDLRPRLYIQIGSDTYSGLIPGNIMVGTTPQNFIEFGGGQNITLKVKIDNAPPEIDIEATVLQWKDMGTWLLDTDRGGIRDEEDFKKAVEAFKEYAERVGVKGEWKSGTEKPEPLERYGDFKNGKFVFQFFGDFGEGDILPEYKIPNAYKDKFEVDLHGHTVYGVNGVDGSGVHNEDLKNKMLSDS